MPTTDTTDVAFEDVFEHLSQYRIIRCKRCRYAVVPKQVERHVKDHHPHINAAQRRQIGRVAMNLPDTAHKSEDVVYPGADAEPIPGFPIVKDVLVCKGQIGEQACGYTCKAIRTMQEHCKKPHGWVNNQKRGGNARAKLRHSTNRMWDSGRWCQRFFEYRQWKRVFPVAGGDEDERNVAVEDSTNAAKRLVQQAKNIIEEAEKEEDASRDHFIANPWMEMTGWHRHLRGLDHKVLLAYIRPAVEENGGNVESGGSIPNDQQAEEADGLAEACRGTKRLIQRAFTTCTPEQIPKATLQTLLRTETAGSTKDFREFYSQQNVKTLRQYMAVWVEMMTYIWRTISLEERPKYRMTEEQRARFERLQRAVSRDAERGRYDGMTRVQRRAARKADRERAIEEACLMFWIAMFDHEIKDHEFESAIISGLAVIGIKRTGEGFMEATDFTPKLSAIVTVLRGMVLYHAWVQRQDEIKRYKDEGMEEEEAKVKARSTSEIVRGPVQQFMTLMDYGGRSTPINHILQQRTYGMAIRNTTKAPAKIGWQGDTILIGKIQFTVEDVRKTIFGLWQTARRRLLRDLLFVDDGEDEDELSIRDRRSGLPSVDVASLFDNEAEDAAGWNFLHDGRNEFVVDGSDWMAKRMFAEPHIRRIFIAGVSDEGVGWKDGGVEKYFRRVRQFKEELLVLVHLSAGAPARATELTSIMSVNPVPGRGRRGIIIDNGLVKFVQGYSKKFRSRKELEIVHRYVPGEVGELVVYFMWLVGPFVRTIRAAARNETKGTPFMWEPPPKEQWQEGENEGEEEMDSESECGIGDGGSVPTHEAEGGGEDDGSAEEAGGVPSSRDKMKQAEPGNVDGIWNTDRVRNTLRRESRERIGVGIGVSDWRHVYPAIQRKYTSDRQVRWIVDRLDEQGGGKGSRGGQNAVDWRSLFSASEVARALQSNHAPRMEEMMYGSTFEEADTSIGSEVRAFRRVSCDWHRFVGWPSALKGERDWKMQQQIEVEQKEAELRHWQRMRSINVETQLKEIFNDTAAQFRGVQRAALRAIVEEGKRRVLVIMRTGGGKSLMFMLPARGSPQGTTVVVVPTKSLQQDLKKRCDKCFIRCAMWDSTRAPPFSAQIVIVIAESAVTKSFARFMNIKHTRGQLDRIVIDECHTILESTAKWRPDVLRLKELSDKGVQVVYLTATLPPSDEGEFSRAVGVSSSDLTWFREATCRPNVSYRVQEYEKGELHEALTRLVEEKKEQYPEGKVIVYCRTVDQTKELAEVLRCRAYYREVGTEKEKGELLTELTEGQERVFTATNALGLGVDAPNIRAVIHTGVPFQLKQYGQESGRAGRDGKISEAVIMRWCSMGGNGRKKTEPDRHADEQMREFIAGEGCRRKVLDRYMDGRADRSACEPQNGEVRCDICSGQPSGSKRRRILVQGVREHRVSGTSEGAGEDVAGNRLDASVEDEAVQVAARLRFARERLEEAAGTERRREEVTGRRRMLERLESRLELFGSGCVICAASGRCAADHEDWRECCASALVVERFSTIRQWLQGIEFENYSGCRECRVPQAICHSWEDNDNREQGQFRQRDDGGCQFRGVLMDAVAASSAVRSNAARRWLKVRIGRDKGRIEGIEDEGEQGLRWLGLRFRLHDGVEGSGLCVMFDEFVGERCGGEEEEEGEGLEESGGEASEAVEIERGRGEEEDEEERLRRRVAAWQRQCTLCAATGKGKRRYDHSLWGCREVGSEEIRGLMKKVQRSYRLAGDTGCRQCMMPRSLCPKFRRMGDSGRWEYEARQKCRYNGVVMAGIMGTTGSGAGGLREQWVEEMGRVGIGESEAVEWRADGRLMERLGRRREWKGEGCSEFTGAFERSIMRLERWIGEG